MYQPPPDPQTPGPRVIVCDTDVSFTVWLGSVLKSVDIETVVFSKVSEVAPYVARHGIVCVILGQRLQGGSTNQVLRTLLDSQPHLAVIVTSSESDVDAAVEAIKIGAFDFLTKPVAEQRLLDAIWHALEWGGQRRGLVQDVVAICEDLETLTEREREVLDLVAQGHLTKQIATNLGICLKTVEAHRAQVLIKMRCKGLGSLVRKYMLATIGAQTLPSARPA